MKLTHTIIINKPLNIVWRNFVDITKLKLWQPTLKQYKLLSGSSATPGSVAELIYEENGKLISMQQIVTSRKEPTEFTGIYKTIGVNSTIANKFRSVAADVTEWQMFSDFQFQSPLLKIFAAFMKGLLYKHAFEDMNRFKRMAEKA